MTDFRKIQLAFDRVYWPLNDLIQRAESWETSRKPYSFADANHETLRSLSKRLDTLSDLCPIGPFVQARKQFGKVDEAYFSADEAQHDLVGSLEAHQHLLDTLLQLRTYILNNGIGIAPIPWWLFWRRWL